MANLRPLLTLLGLVGTLAIGVLAGVYALGFLRPDALWGPRAANRQPRAGWGDLTVGIFIFFSGVVLADSLRRAMDWVPETPNSSATAPAAATQVSTTPADDSATEPSPAEEPELDAPHKLAVTLLSQALTLLPVALYFVARAIVSRRRWARLPLPGVGVAGEIWPVSAGADESVAQALREAGILPRKFLVEAGQGLVGLIVALPLVMTTSTAGQVLTLLTGHELPEYGHRLLKTLHEPAPPAITVGLWASAVLVAPLLEEFVFRGLVQSAVASVLGPARWWTVAFTAAMFAMVHWGIMPAINLPAIFVLALVLGWLYERTGSLWPGIVAHMGFNAVNMALSYVGK